MIPKYRADIDGLRAVAVLSVIFYHLGASVFSGGYVGVDIFFVISGYLITTIIVREIASSDFSIARFYARRARRILPALTAVVIATLAVGSALLAPGGLADLGRSTVATALFSSNILFFHQAGYFDGPAEMKPLLHTWSLAVEEQYYIFFPMLLMLVARRDDRRYFKWLAVLGSLSFIACAVGTHFDSSATFYLIPFRAWELFMGSILALHLLPSPRHQYVREGTATLGLGLIAFAVFGFTSETSFPGVAAAIPTMGAALIIYAGIGGQSIVSRFLSLRPAVFIGLISYSLYLWHWPVIAFSKLYSITGPSKPQIIVMMAGIFFLSVLSWRYVEIPFRKHRLLSRSAAALGAASAILASMLGSGILLAANQGGIKPAGPFAGADLATADPEWDRWDACEKRIKQIDDIADLCEIGAATGQVDFVLWGDSHARALASGVQLSAAAHGQRGRFASRLACPPLTLIERPSRTSCNEFNQAMLRAIAHAPQIKTVILVARWALSTTGSRYKEESGGPVRLVDLASGTPTDGTNVALFDAGLERTIQSLHKLGKRVVLVNPVPEVGYDVPSASFAAQLTGRDLNRIIGPTREEYKRRTSDVTAIFDKAAEDNLVELVDPSTYLCRAERCLVVIKGTPLYRDDDHLSTFGSKYVSPAFDKIFKELASQRP
jgi:peptidoglycan/LPS O-acetylase OafA/YrhL